MTEATLGSQISDLPKEIKDTLTHLKKWEADIAVIKTVSNRLVERIVKTERQCWEKDLDFPESNKIYINESLCPY